MLQKKQTLAVVVDSLDVDYESLRLLIRRIFSTTDKFTIFKSIVVLSVHAGLDSLTSSLESLVREFNGRVYLEVVSDHTFAYSYTRGLQRALELNANYIVELDSGGGHLPEELPRFIRSLQSCDAALASRFLPGATNSYPLQRRLVSLGATCLVNCLFGLPFKCTDATSGFQGFRADVLERIFAAYPPEKWRSVVQGPFHMYQTEMRLLLGLLPGALEVKEIPITYGAEKHGKNLGFLYLLKSLWCLVMLWRDKSRIRNSLSAT